MTAVQNQIDSYFSSINPVAKKISQDCGNFREKYGEEWNNFTLEQQDQLIDNYIIDPNVAEKYDVLDREDLPVCFPKYRVNCGEKIVVDFDQEDGWTWQDEHSGPFSWKTKSQQDLTLEDLDDLSIEPKEGSKRQKMIRKSRSPEPRFDPPGQQADTQEVEQIFQKFGITFHNKDDESCDEAENSDKNDSHENLEEVAAALVHTDEFQRQSFVFEEHEDQHAQSNSSVSYSREGSMGHSEFTFEDFHHGRETLDRTQSSSERSSSTMSSNSSKGKKKNGGSGKSKEKVRVVKSRPEAEQSLLTDLAISVEKHRRHEDDIGQVSPVFIADQGESSTDIDVVGTTYKFPESTASSTYDYSDTTTMSSHSRSEVLVSSHVSSHVEEEEDWGSAFTSTDKSEDSGAASKTGFDFLDNW